MKILVFDDNLINLAAAQAQLGADHDLTTVDSYDAAQKALRPWGDYKPNFDVVLTDLLVPPSRQEQGQRGMLYVGSELPVGIFIGLLAAVKARARYVGVFTDAGHHDHPASACFDAFNGSEGNPTPFRVEESTVLLCNTRHWVGLFEPDNLARQLELGEGRERTDLVRAKNWAAILRHLTKEQ